MDEDDAATSDEYASGSPERLADDPEEGDGGL